MTRPTVYIDPTEAWDRGWQPHVTGVPKKPEDSLFMGPISGRVEDLSAGSTRNTWEPSFRSESMTRNVRENEAPFHAGAFDDSVGAAFRTSAVYTLATGLYESLDQLNQPSTPLTIEPERLYGLSEDEVDGILSSKNQAQAEHRLAWYAQIREDNERMAQGDFLSRMGASFIGSIGDAGLGGPAGSIGASVGNQIGRRLLASGRTVQAASRAARVTGSVTGNLLGGAGSELAAMAYDPTRGWEDVAGAALFDAAGVVGGIRGAYLDTGGRTLSEHVANAVNSLQTSVEGWVKRGESPDASVKAPDGAVDAQTARDMATPKADGTEAPAASTNAPDPVEPPPLRLPEHLASRAPEDISWISDREARNLGVRFIEAPDGSRYRNTDITALELPKGWRTSEGAENWLDLTPEQVARYKAAFEQAARQSNPSYDPTTDPTGEIAWEGNDGNAGLPVNNAFWDEAREKTVDEMFALVDDPDNPGQSIFGREAMLEILTRGRYKLGHLAKEGNVYTDKRLPPVIAQMAKDLLGEFGGPNTTLTVAYTKIKGTKDNPAPYGLRHSVGNNHWVIELNSEYPVHKMRETLIHEMGHALLIPAINRVDSKTRVKWKEAIQKVQELMRDPQKYEAAVLARFGYGTDLYNHMMAAQKAGKADGLSLAALLGKAGRYWGNWDEINAQQSVKFIQRRWREIKGKGKPGAWVPGQLLAIWVKDTLAPVMKLLKKMDEDPDELYISERMDAVFEAAIKANKEGLTGGAPRANVLMQTLPDTEPGLGANRAELKAIQQLSEEEVLQYGRNSLKDPKKSQGGGDAGKEEEKEAEAPKASSSYTISKAGEEYGLGLSNQTTPEEVAGLVMQDKALQRALDEAPPPVIAERTSRILGSKALRKHTGIFISAGQIALSSKNPVVRWVGHIVGESASNATGQRRASTAATRRYHLERRIIGGSIEAVRHARRDWFKEQRLPVWRSLFDTKDVETFNRQLQKHLFETYSSGSIPEGVSPAMQKAIEAMRDLHQRANDLEKLAKMPGTISEDLPALGYMQRILDPEKIGNLTKDQKILLVDDIEKQLLAVDFSPKVARKVAVRYVDRAEKARAGVFTPQEATIDNENSIRVVQALLREEGYGDPEIEALTGTLLRDKDKHLERKLKLDEEKDMGGGLVLGDLLWNDHESMLRQRARATAGWIALAEHGVYGYEGMRAVMAAAAKGSGDLQATREELDAIQQIMSEVSGVPLDDGGGVYYNKVIDGAVAATAAIRLGGLGYTQLAEFYNIGAQVGFMAAFEKVPEIGRLHRELKDRRAEKAVTTGTLRELEDHMGISFGTDGYFLASPWDTNGRIRDIRGSEETSKFIRGINALGHALGIVNGFRVIHAVQNRMAAELTLEQVMNRIKAGTADDVWLKDIGITGELADYLKANVERLNDWDGNKTTLFKAKQMDPNMLSQLTEVIFRSTNQMIQGTFAGERGKYVHDAFWRASTQFRGFTITSLEKQVARQIGNYGYGRVALLLMAQMAGAIPIVMLRGYMASLGRENQEEYLEDRLSLANVLRDSMNYTALSGLAGDIADVGMDITGTTPYNTKAVGGRFLPSAGLINDAYDVISNPSLRALNLLPFASHPLAIPAMNLIKSEMGSD